MKILVVDDEKIALKRIVRVLSRLYPEADIVSTQDPGTAEMLFDQDVDIAFLDIEMPGMTGIELGKILMSKKKNLNLIYLTAYSEYALEAYHMHASGYLTKPIDEYQLMEEMENLRFLLSRRESVLTVKCFGNFEAFLSGRPIHFSRSSSKEVLAYLVDRRGSSVTIDEICASFWEDLDEIEKKKSNIRTTIKALRKTLEENDLKDVLISHRNSYAVDPSRIECDYYKYLEGSEEGKKLFQGEYMSQYSWAERTLGNLIDWTQE